MHRRKCSRDKGRYHVTYTWPIEKTEQRREGFISESKQRNFLVYLEGHLISIITSWKKRRFLMPTP
jgi:hypothetical protein